MVERFFNKVGKPSDVVGVGIDGGIGHVADHQIFGEPLGDFASSLFVGRHKVLLKEKRLERRVADNPP